MKPNVVITLAAAFVTVVLRAGPAENAIVAAMKLSEARSYTWVTDVTDDARSYTIQGKTDLSDKEGFSQVTMPAPTRRWSGRRPTGGRGETNSTAERTAIFHGDEHYVVETPDGWKTEKELANEESAASRGSYGGRRGSGGFGGRSGYPRGRGSRGDGSESGSSGPYSNLQPTISRPHEEIAIIVAGYTDLKPESDGVSGTLSEMSAKLLLVHPGQDEKITPVRASGTFRLWVSNGTLVKYRVKLEGALKVDGPSGRRDVEVHETTTTTLREVGTTTVDVPVAARKKLGA